MKKNNIWIILAVVYVFVIGAVVVYRMNMNQTNEKVDEVSELATITPTPVAAVEQLDTRFESEVTSEGYQDVSLTVLDPVTFESAGYTLELMYDPAVLKIVSITEGDVWEESVVLQKDESVAGVLTYSVGRQLQSASTGGNLMATVRFEVLDEMAETTEVTLGQISKSAEEGNVKVIVAEPLMLKLK